MGLVLKLSGVMNTADGRGERGTGAFGGGDVHFPARQRADALQRRLQFVDF